ncbi:MAG: hypothetical protein QNJ51_02245 [Calothrix sp. MO_167.B12]|nr:hypothetical protein [Calothrix sp. MO_167.B12]
MSNTDLINDCNTSDGRDVAMLRLCKNLFVASFFEIGITLLILTPTEGRQPMGLLG